MKTFFTEKHNIPEGATHYLDETCNNFFYWGMKQVDGFKLHPTDGGGWVDVNSKTFNANCKPIPQTKEVEWVNGEPLEFRGEPCVFIGMSEGFPIVKYTKDADPALAGDIDEIFAVEMLNKPEAQEDREKREIEELLTSKVNFNNSFLPRTIARILLEAGYRKGGE